jgi:hypothetical protein
MIQAFLFLLESRILHIGGGVPPDDDLSRPKLNAKESSYYPPVLKIS